MKRALLYCALVAGLHLLTLALPPAFTWGFHFLKFLPSTAALLYAALALLLIFGLTRESAASAVASVAAFMEKRKMLFLLLTAAAVACVAKVFEIRVPLLGDAWFMIGNLIRVNRGIDVVIPRDEPLATYYFAAFTRWTGAESYREVIAAFYLGEMVLMLGFVICLFLAVRKLFPDPQSRLVSLLFILSLPVMNLFFGYIETYAVVLAVVALYVLTAVRYLERGSGFILPALAFLLMGLTHYLTLLMGPSLAYLAFLGLKNKGGKKDVLIGCSAAGAILFAIFAANGFSVRGYYSAMPHKHYLPFAPPSAWVEVYSSPYTLFSGYHVVDILNLALLLAPWMLFFFLTRREETAAGSSPTAGWLLPRAQQFLLAALAGPGLFFLVAKFDLGAPRDWDLVSPYSFLAALAGMVWVFRRVKTAAAVRLLLPVWGITALNSVFWFSFHSSDQACIDRFAGLLDRRMTAQGTWYTAALTLASYHHEEGNSASTAGAWEDYVRQFPDDSRGYANVLGSLGDTDASGVFKRIDTWLPMLADTSSPREVLFDYCSKHGSAALDARKLEIAGAWYGKALAIRPESPAVLNELGVIAAQKGNLEEAALRFETAVAQDARYAEGWKNLARAAALLGRSDESRRASENLRLLIDSTGHAGH